MASTAPGGPGQQTRSKMVLRRSSGNALRTEQDTANHPYGSKGADLIETIRIDTLSGSSRSTANLHPSTARTRPWAEPPAKYVRPKSAAARTTCKVYSPELLQELLPLCEAGTADGSLNLNAAAPDSPERPAMPVRPASAAAIAVSVSRSMSRSTLSTTPLAAVRHRPASAQPASQRELLRHMHDAAAERRIRRLRQRQQEDVIRTDRTFSAQWALLEKEEKGFIPALNDYFQLRGEEKTRRQRAMHKAWETSVFDKISDQVQQALALRFQSDPGARWIEAQNRYLEAFKRKDGNLFRDIIIADEYDPMVCAKQALKYSEKKVGNDPMKAELAAAAAERATVPGVFAAVQGSTRETLDPTMWNHLDVTPWGDRMLKPKAPHPGALRNQRAQVSLQHYEFPLDRGAIDAELRKGKRQFTNLKR